MISVIIVTYNSINVLPQCIESLGRCEGCEGLELIVVDNSSTDNTWNWILDCAKYFEHVFMDIKCLRLDLNKGYAYANNRGAELASGDVFLFLNPDTVVGVNAISKCIARFSLNSNIGAVGCRLELISGELDKACRRSLPTFWNSFTYFSRLSRLFPNSRLFSSYGLSYLEEAQSYEVECLCGAFLMTRRDVFFTVGAFDEEYFMYGEDVDLCWKVKQAGYQVWYEGEVTTIHIKGGNGGKKSAVSLYHFYNSMFIYYRKHFRSSRVPIASSLLRFLTFMMYKFHSSNTLRS